MTLRTLIVSAAAAALIGTGMAQAANTAARADIPDWLCAGSSTCTPKPLRPPPDVPPTPPPYPAPEGIQQR